MTVNELKDYFISSYRFNKVTGISHTQWIRWITKGYIPIGSQLKIEKTTHGALKARIEDLGYEQI
jgi:hypothetical protein